MTPPPPEPDSGSAADASNYWGTYKGHTTVTAKGARFNWGTLMRLVADEGKRVIVRRSRFSARNPQTTPAVAVPYSWWQRRSGERPPRRSDVIRARQANLGISALLDRVQDTGTHMQVQRLRDIDVVFVPLAWYEDVAEVEIATPEDRNIAARGRRSH